MCKKWIDLIRLRREYNYYWQLSELLRENITCPGDINRSCIYYASRERPYAGEYANVHTRQEEYCPNFKMGYSVCENTECPYHDANAKYVGVLTQKRAIAQLIEETKWSRKK